MKVDLQEGLTEEGCFRPASLGAHQGEPLQQM